MHCNGTESLDLKLRCYLGWYWGKGEKIQQHMVNCLVTQRPKWKGKLMEAMNRKLSSYWFSSNFNCEINEQITNKWQIYIIRMWQMHYCTSRLSWFWSRAIRIVSHYRLRPCACITRDWSYKKSPLAVRAALDHKSNKAQLCRLWSLHHKSKDSCVLVCTERANGTEPIYLDSLVGLPQC